MRRRSQSAVALWILVALVVAGGAAAVALGRLATGAVLDLVSLWPLALLPVVLWVALTPARHRGRSWLGVFPPLAFIGWLGLGVWLHLSAFPPLPSTSAELTGPAVEQTAARISVDIGGVLEVGRQTQPGLYVVSFLRQAGPVGAPEAVELPLDDRIEVVITPRPANPWFRYEGWRVALAPQPEWTVVVTGHPLQADLSRLNIREVVACCSGRVVLPAPSNGTPITVTGSLSVVVPMGTPVEVFGQATTPPGWTKTAGGWRSPDLGVGYRISVVVGKTVAIEYP